MFHKNHFKLTSVWIMIFIRLAAGLYLFVNPLWGFFWFLMADFWDAYIFKHKARMSWREYHTLDKNIDWFGYFCMFAVGVRAGYFFPLIYWLIFKLVGQIIFIKTHKTFYFIFFPNIFEMMFLWYVVLVGQLGFDGWGKPFSFWFILSVAIKEVQEIWLHFLWPNYLRKFGYPKFLHKFGYEKEIEWE